MNAAEALKICRLAKALSPAQAVDEYTPDAWALVLRNTRYVDAEQALVELGGEREWIHVSHIKGRVKGIRDARSRAFGTPPDPPHEIGGDPEAYHHWYVQTMRAVRDGDLTRENYQAPALATAADTGRPSLRELLAAATPNQEDR